MSNTATGRAARANQSAKAKVKDQTCPTCPKKKCDAKLPEDEATRKAALTIYGESTANTDEMSAIGSVMHNRVGGSGFRPTLVGVIQQPGQFKAFEGKKYRDAESGDLKSLDCEALKNAIATAENLKNNGVPAQYNRYRFFQAARNAPPGGTRIGGTVFYENYWN